MTYFTIRLTVADYAKWRPIFDADGSRRLAGGATGVQSVYRDLANPNDITMLFEWDNLESAQRFLQDPALAENMQLSGVVSAPEIRFLTLA